MLKVNSDLRSAIVEYTVLLENEKYFEAHEVLEEAWHHLRLTQDPLSNFVKGLINAAIAFEHIKRNKKNALQKAKRVMVSYDRHKGIYGDNIRHSKLFVKALKRVEFLKISLMYANNQILINF